MTSGAPVTLSEPRYYREVRTWERVPDQLNERL
jgi:hypothetical protein